MNNKNLSNLLTSKFSFIGGVSQLFDFTTSQNQFTEQLDEETADLMALYSDWYILGEDMNTAVNQFKKNISHLK